MLNAALTARTRQWRAMNAPVTFAADAYRAGLGHSARHGRHAQAIACFEQALAADPDDAKVLFALGNTARALGLGAAAEDFFRPVLATEPDRSGSARQSGQSASAPGAVRRKPQHPGRPRWRAIRECAELWLTLGSVLREQGDAAAAETHYREALD